MRSISYDTGRLRSNLLCCTVFTWLFFFSLPVNAQDITVFEKKRLTVADGLPQSYVSGLVQDTQGFIWIGTRDGLARYDGRNFKVFRSKHNATSGLAANVIMTLFLDRHDQLWIHYQNGDIDIFNTHTERITHFTSDAVYRACFASVKPVNGIIQTAKHEYWLLNENGGVFIADLQKHQLRSYNQRQLGLGNSRITGMSAMADGTIALVTDSTLVQMTRSRKVIKTTPFAFARPHLFNPRRSWKDNAPILRKDGSWVIIDEDRLVIYDAAGHGFITKPMPKIKFYVPSFHVIDKMDNVLFSFDGLIYRLSPGNVLSVWKERGPFPREGIMSMLYDSSGVLWLGTNGYDLRSIDMRIPRMLLQPYHSVFADDVLRDHLGVDSLTLQRSAIGGANPYLLRWANDKDGNIWMTNAGPDLVPNPNICSYRNGRLDNRPWRYADSSTQQHTRISSIAFSKKGQLYGLDFYMRPLKLDTQTRTVSLMPQINIEPLDKRQMVNSIAIEGEHIFWITTTRGLLRYDVLKQAVQTFDKLLPVSDLTVLVNDPLNDEVLWIGSLGGGLIKLNKRTFKYQILTTEDDLPNNTIYGMIPIGWMLWCSSNKGIFAFDPVTKHIKSYTALDGLAADEFNQFHFLKLPDSRLAFGGTKGYTVFNPVKFVNDDFFPSVAITELKINNLYAGDSNSYPGLSAGVNAIKELVLTYEQNFLNFEFSALEYNIPQKLRYRYRLIGIDKNWVETESGMASYTALDPGHYTLQINATNTAGNWGPYIKQLDIVITPPFWRTWWFMTIILATVVVATYIIVRFRISGVRKQEQQKLKFEREVIELETQALRAQMNPHFIFNCLNSMKALVQDNRNSEAVQYLTLFAKLVRSKIGTVQQEVSLFDELQTCRIYIKLEAIRFKDEIVCEFLIDDEVNTFEVSIPPLLLQPIIENAIWHGILPKGIGGKITVKIQRHADQVHCIIEDNGIGRERSEAGKSRFTATHRSRGLELIANRLKLHNATAPSVKDMEIIDKRDDAGNVAGTIVVIKLNL